MKTSWTQKIHGINLTFEDISTSSTVPYVFNELLVDVYGLNKIILSEDDVVIDIGGNVGMFSIYVKKKFNCKVIAFEPVLMNFEQFKKNIILNNLSLDDIELHNTAITNIENGEIKIKTQLFNTGGSSFFLNWSDYDSICKTERIDKYINNNCKYIKIDCEGGEHEIIPSMLHKLTHVKYIGIEYHDYIKEHNSAELNNLLKRHFKGEIFHNL